MRAQEHIEDVTEPVAIDDGLIRAGALMVKFPGMSKSPSMPPSSLAPGTSARRSRATAVPAEDDRIVPQPPRTRPRLDPFSPR